MVWSNLIKNILKTTNDIQLLEYKNSTQNLFRCDLNILEAYIKVNSHPISPLSYFLSPKVYFKLPFIFHSSYFRICNNPNAINVTTIHDFIYEQSSPTLKQKLRICLDYRAIKKSDAIVCVSNNTKKDLFKFIPNIDSRKVHVIYNGVSEDYKLINNNNTYGQFKDYILFVGGRQGYKNFDFVINCLKNTNHKLLICGSPLSAKEIQTLEQKLNNRYKCIIYPSNEELNKIYNSVFTLVYPSSYEGFGIPVLEAQRAGCPVIALNASSIPEIIGDTPLLINELSETQFIEKLNLLKDKDIRQKIIESGLINSRRFSWEKMATEYFNLYCKLLEERKKS